MKSLQVYENLFPELFFKISFTLAKFLSKLPDTFTVIELTVLALVTFTSSCLES